MRPLPPDVLLLLFERFELPPERPELGRFELRLREEAEPPEGAALDDERRRVRDPLVVPPPDRRLVPAVGGREFRFVC